MILGIGIDAVDVPEVARRLERGAMLTAFSDRERAHADSLPEQRAEILAARWAAKEAFGKALGTGLRTEWPLDQIEVVHDDAGRPHIELGPALKGLLVPGASIHCSLSHTRATAVACLVIEKQ